MFSFQFYKQAENNATEPAYSTLFFCILLYISIGTNDRYRLPIHRSVLLTVLYTFRYRRPWRTIHFNSKVFKVFNVTFVCEAELLMRTKGNIHQAHKARTTQLINFRKRNRDGSHQEPTLTRELQGLSIYCVFEIVKIR